MSVELLDSPRFYGYRVRRQVAGENFQEYFSLKPDGKRLRGAAREAVLAQAQTRDEELAGRQAKTRDAREKQLNVDADGRIKGILFRLKREKSGSMTPVFQVGVLSKERNKVVNTTVSINRYGLNDAWLRAVAFYCTHKHISRRSKLYRELLQHRPSKQALKRLTENGA